MPDAINQSYAAQPLTTGRTLDHAATVYDWLSPLMTFGMEHRYRRIALEHLALDHGNRVLDVGCGTGTLTRQIAQKLSAVNGADVVGIDAAPKMIDVARRKALHISNIRYDVAASEDLPYRDEAFSHAISTFFFHHIDFKLKVRSLNEMWRVMQTGGKAVIVDVDIPTNSFGRLCAWSGYLLFQQPEIRENIEGGLRTAMDSSHFASWQPVSHHNGYITVFTLKKQAKTIKRKGTGK